MAVMVSSGQHRNGGTGVFIPGGARIANNSNAASSACGSVGVGSGASGGSSSGGSSSSCGSSSGGSAGAGSSGGSRGTASPHSPGSPAAQELITPTQSGDAVPVDLGAAAAAAGFGPIPSSSPVLPLNQMFLRGPLASGPNLATGCMPALSTGTALSSPGFAGTMHGMPAPAVETVSSCGRNLYHPAGRRSLDMRPSATTITTSPFAAPGGTIRRTSDSNLLNSAGAPAASQVNATSAAAAAAAAVDAAAQALAAAQAAAAAANSGTGGLNPADSLTMQIALLQLQQQQAQLQQLQQQAGLQQIQQQLQQEALLQQLMVANGASMGESLLSPMPSGPAPGPPILPVASAAQVLSSDANIWSTGGNAFLGYASLDAPGQVLSGQVLSGQVLSGNHLSFGAGAAAGGGLGIPSNSGNLLSDAARAFEGSLSLKSRGGLGGGTGAGGGGTALSVASNLSASGMMLQGAGALSTIDEQVGIGTFNLRSSGPYAGNW